jgi:hypothetical protein
MGKFMTVQSYRLQYHCIVDELSECIEETVYVW